MGRYGILIFLRRILRNMETDLTKLVVDLKPLLWKAADGVMEIYLKQDFNTQEKMDKSPITEADLFSHKTLVQGISEITPDWTIISEENKTFDNIDEASFYWVIDPLDGTKEFIAQNGEFTINVALVHGNYPVLGLVLAPVFDELYFAVKGEGAFRELRNSPPERILVSDFDPKQENLRVLCSRSHLNQETIDYMNQFVDPKTIGKGGSMKFMDIASGRADIYPRFGPTMEWDTCAPQIIVEEAGGQLIDQKTMKRMAYGKERFLNNYFVVFANQI